MAEKNLVFVYGTLMTGMGNHNKLIGQGGATLVGRGTTVTRMKMFAAGVPFVDPDEKLGSIHGEVWEVDAASLIRMDALEEHPDWYFRLPMKIKLLAEEDAEQVVVVAEIYLNRKFKKFGMDVDAVVVSTGDFRDADTLEKQQALRQQQQQEVEQQEQQQLSVSSDASPEQISLHRSFAFLDLIESSEGEPWRSSPVSSTTRFDRHHISAAGSPLVQWLAPLHFARHGSAAMLMPRCFVNSGLTCSRMLLDSEKRLILTMPRSRRCAVLSSFRISI